MKIALFHNVSPGGAKRVIYEQVKFLIEKKIEVDFYTYETNDDSFMPLKGLVNNVFKYKFINSRSDGGMNRLKYDISIFFKLRNLSKYIAEEIDKKKYDAVLVHPDNLTQAPYILKYLKTPTLYFCEELLRNTYENMLDVDKNLPFLNYIYEKAVRSIRKIIDKNNAREATVVMTASRYIKQKVKMAYGKNAVVNKLGVNFNTFKQTSNIKRGYLLFIGRKEKITGYDFALEVLNILKKRININLKVIDYKNDKLKLSDREMARVYSDAFATLCVSYNEPFGLSSIESMACGTPVLAVNDGGYKESVLDGETGYLLERDAILFAEKVMRLKKNLKLYKQLSLNAVKHVRSSYTWRRHNDYLYKVLLSLNHIK